MKCYFVIPFLIGIQLAESITWQEMGTKVVAFRNQEEQLRSKAFPADIREITDMPEFGLLNQELKKIALQELAYFEENGIDIRKLHRYVKNQKGNKTTKDILHKFSAVLALFASMPLKARLETSFFNALRRRDLYKLLEKHLSHMLWCKHEENGQKINVLSYNEKADGQTCSSKTYLPIGNPTYNQLFNNLLFKAGDFKAAESMPDAAWRGTVIGQLAVKNALREHEIMPQLLRGMFTESCLKGISHDRYKIVAGSRGLPTVYKATNNETTNFLDVFKNSLEQFNIMVGEKHGRFHKKCGPRFTADIVWTAYSGLIDLSHTAIINKFKFEVKEAEDKKMGHLIAAMDVLGDQYYIPENVPMKKFSAHKYGLEFINGAKEANRPFLSSYGWNLFPLKDPREDNTYDMYTIGHFTETPYHNNLAISHLYPKIAADLMAKNAKAVNLCLLNLHCVHNIDSMLHKFLYERGVPVMVQGCDESLNGREHYLNSYYLFLNTMDIRAVLAASLNSISHSGLDEERKNELRSHFIADFKAFVRVGSSLLKEYDVRKQLHRNSQNPDILKAPKPFQG